MEFNRPAKIEGELLADEIRAAGLPVDEVWLHGDTLHVDGPGDDDRSTVQQVIDDHNPPDPPPDPDAELANAIEGAGNLTELKDALLGRLSKGRAAGRPTA